MGRNNTAFFDDLLLQKTKGIIEHVLDNLNSHDEIQHVHALSSRETNERYRNVSGMASSEIRAIEEARRKVTFEHFVENLNGQEAFVRNLVELLVSETIRNAIKQSMDERACSKNGQDAMIALRTQSDIEWKQDCEQSQRLQIAVEKITRASRRSESWVDGYASSSSSSSESDLTITPYERLATLGNVPRAPPSVLPSVLNGIDGGETTRTTRNERASTMLSNAASRSRRSELMANRTQAARTSRFRQTQIQGLRNARRSRLEEAERMRWVRGANSPLQTPGITNTDTEEDPTANLVHRFLTQPFPSESRSMSSRLGREGPSSSEANDIDLLNSINSIYGGNLPSPIGSHVENVSVRERQDGAEAQARLLNEARLATEERARVDDFESFSNTRRRHQRILQDGSDPTLDQAFNTMARADESLERAEEVIREVTLNAGRGSPSSSRGARRYELPAFNEHRPVVRLPNRLINTRRVGEEQEGGGGGQEEDEE